MQSVITNTLSLYRIPSAFYATMFASSIHLYRWISFGVKLFKISMRTHAEDFSTRIMSTFAYTLFYCSIHCNGA